MRLKFLSNKKFLTVLNISVAVLSLVVIVWKLSSSLTYQDKSVSLSSYFYFIYVLLLVPLNWLLEAYKWRMLMGGVHRFSLTGALRRVIEGLPFGIITPARVGEWYGRTADLTDKKQSLALTSIGGLTQQVVTVIAGVAGSVYIRLSDIRLVILAVVIAMILLLLILWLWQARFLQAFYLNASRVSLFLKVLVLSILRYCVFVGQYVLLLRFFSVGVDLSTSVAIIALSYLISYLLPLNAFVDLGLRSSAMILFFAPLTDNLAGVILSGLVLWTVNVALPSVIGASMLVRKNLFLHKDG